MPRVTTCFCLLAISLSGVTTQGESLQFTGSGGGYGEIYIELNGVSMNDPKGSPYPIQTLIDVDLNAAEQSIVYNQYALSTSIPISLVKNTTHIIPGTFDTVEISTTVIIDPFLTIATDVGPLDIILTPPTTLDVESNIFGDQGGFPNLAVTGSYVIEGPTEMVSDNFSFTMAHMVPGTGGLPYAFPQDGLTIYDYPNSITLGHGSSGENRVSYWYPTMFFSGEVDGIGYELVLHGFVLRRPESVTLSGIPEPSTLVLLGVGAISLLAYAWRRR